MPRFRHLAQNISILSRCRLCLRITLAVFLAIFVVEAAILVPSYQNYERDLLARLDEVGRTAAKTMFLMHGHSNPRDLKIAGATATRTSNLVGGAIYKTGWTPYTVFGEVPGLSPESVRSGGPTRRYAIGTTRYDSIWAPEVTGLPFTIVGRMDSSGIRGQLIAFLWRIGGLVLLISSFVCAVTMFILGRSVLIPLLKVRDNLVEALADPALADRYTLDESRDDELGDVVGKLNEMLRRVGKTYREELATMLSMVDRSAEGMLVYDVTGRIVYANHACLGLCGFNDIETMQNESLPRFAKADQSAPHHLIDVLSNGGYTGEVTLTGRNDSRVPCVISGMSLDDADGQPFRYFATITDISQLREMYDSLEQQNFELAASNRAKSQFLANMSHELRTPLNAIIGFSEIMRNESVGKMDNPQYKEFSHHIHESGTHLLDLISDILDLSKVEAGKLILDEDTVDPGRAIESSLRLIRGRAEEHSIALRAVIAPTLPGLIVDERKLKQVLINLLSNAVKFTPDGGEVTVTAETMPSGDFAIRIADTGVGISEQDLPNVFTLFMQVDGDFDRRYEGTGLGLPLTKAIVELHDGTIRLDSELGRGTTVTVQLPKKRLVA